MARMPFQSAWFDLHMSSLAQYAPLVGILFHWNSISNAMSAFTIDPIAVIEFCQTTNHPNMLANSRTIPPISRMGTA
jgi:hypothetical protein